jgi:general secretion pathway protein I
VRAKCRAVIGEGREASAGCRVGGAGGRRLRGEPRAARRERSRSATGFTLLEVVVAIALMGAVLAAALELLAVGLRSAKTAGEYTQAVLMARLKLDELALQEPEPMSSDGTFGEAYRWTDEVAPAEQEAEGVQVRLFRMHVKVSWAGKSGEKGVELVTLRGASEAPPPSQAGGGRGAQVPGAASPAVQRGVAR